MGLLALVPAAHGASPPGPSHGRASASQGAGAVCLCPEGTAVLMGTSPGEPEALVMHTPALTPGFPCTHPHPEVACGCRWALPTGPKMSPGGGQQRLWKLLGPATCGHVKGGPWGSQWADQTQGRKFTGDTVSRRTETPRRADVGRRGQSEPCSAMGAGAGWLSRVGRQTADTSRSRH